MSINSKKRAARSTALARSVTGLLAFGALLLSACLPALCAETVIPNFWDARDRLAKPDLSGLQGIRFLTATDFPPFNFLDTSGKLAGFDVDLARAICRELGILDKCRIQALPWGTLQDALTKGEGDAVVAGLAVTPQSRAIDAFSRSYLQFPARFVVARGEATDEPIEKTIAGKRVGVIAGSAHERMLHAYFPSAKAMSYEDEKELHAALKEGRIDAIFADGMRLSFWLGGTDSAGCCRFAGGPYLSNTYLGGGMAIATRPDDPMLTTALDYALHQIGVKGTFSELYLRYFPISFY